MSTSKKFALIGLGGYIAEHHLKAIQGTGNTLVCTLDKFDSVGIIDSYFPEADFFVEFERFDRHLDKLKRTNGQKIDYVSICTPNYLHDSHIRFALKQQADAICEKPMVLNPWNVDALQEFEKETGKRIWNILQLRLHPSIQALRQKYTSSPQPLSFERRGTQGIAKKAEERIHDITLTYITSRGNWYNTSWKADISKSGGVATNIGIHFFDMLGWIFGETIKNTVHLHQANKAAGYLELKNARIRWLLSIDSNDLPKEIKERCQRTYRSITIENQEIEFSDGFTDLHTRSYEEILAGNGFGVSEVRQSIQTAYEIRNATPVGLKGEYHPFLKKL